jgi:hypothetical protein
MEMRMYYRAVWLRAGHDAWRWIGSHVRFTAALLVVTFLVGLVFGARVDGATLTGLLLIPLAALGCVAILAFAIALVRAPVALAGDAAAEAAASSECAVEQALAERADGDDDADAGPVSDEHRDALREVAATLRGYVVASQHAFYGGPGDERRGQSFAEHFPAVAELISVWNKQIAALEAERRELRERVEARLRALAYDRPPFSWGWAGVISGSAEAEDAELPFHVTPLQPLWLELGSWQLIPDPPPGDRTRQGIEDELRAVLSEAAEQPQREQIRQIHSSLSEASETLIEGLDLIAEKDVINGLGDCLLCR